LSTGLGPTDELDSSVEAGCYPGRPTRIRSQQSIGSKNDGGGDNQGVRQPDTANSSKRRRFSGNWFVDRHNLNDEGPNEPVDSGYRIYPASGRPDEDLG
jgi:hypothetical protein